MLSKGATGALRHNAGYVCTERRAGSDGPAVADGCWALAGRALTHLRLSGQVVRFWQWDGGRPTQKAPIIPD